MLTPDARAQMRDNIAQAQAKLAGIPMPQGGTTMRAPEKVMLLVLLDILAALVSIDERLGPGKEAP